MEDKIIKIAQYICQNCDETLPLSFLARMAGQSPSYFQKAFKVQIGMSPKELQKTARKKVFKEHLKTSNNIIDAIFAAGFGSTSRVYENIDAIGINPKSYKKGAMGEIIYYSIKPTKDFKILMAASEIGVCAVEIGNDENALFAGLKDEFPNAQLKQTNDSQELNDWLDALIEYLNHNGVRPNLPLDLRGTILQEKIWRFLTQLQKGETISYGELSDKIGLKSGARAIANAVGKNKIAILVPCHKVLRMDGSIGGYKWGAKIKEKLLQEQL